MALPELNYEHLRPTRDYLRDVALTLSSLQRAFLPRQPRLWQYGLEVTMRGLSTQAFRLAGSEYRANLDFVRQVVRLDDQSWPLDEYGGRRLFEQFRLWLSNHMADAKLKAPEFSGAADFNAGQAGVYAEALWWLDEQFRRLKAEIKGGVISPILLYPHHFDLALSWFPHDDERQLTIGWSSGDQNLTEPYLYLTAYPEPDNFKKPSLPAEAHWQTEGFSGAVLSYTALQASRKPEELFGRFAANFKQNPWA